jgi:hypothetical protein
MLLPYTALTYYGPSCGAGIGTVEPVSSGQLRSRGRLGGVGIAQASGSRGDPTLGRAMRGVGVSQAQGVGQVRVRSRLGGVGKVNELSQSDVAAAVWGQAAAQYNLAGTMGAKLNAAGAASDPWSVTLEGSYTAADLLRIASAVLAGDASGTNQPGTTVFRSLDGTKDRVTATQTEGARTITALDGS